MNILSTLEIRSGSQGFILTIAHVTGSKKPFYFNTDDLEQIRKGLELRSVTVDNSFSIDDRRVSPSVDRISA